MSSSLGFVRSAGQGRGIMKSNSFSAVPNPSRLYCMPAGQFPWHSFGSALQVHPMLEKLWGLCWYNLFLKCLFRQDSPGSKGEPGEPSEPSKPEPTPSKPEQVETPQELQAAAAVVKDQSQSSSVPEKDLLSVQAGGKSLFYVIHVFVFFWGGRGCVLKCAFFKGTCFGGEVFQKPSLSGGTLAYSTTAAGKL